MTATVKTENGSGDVNVADGKDDQIASQIEYYFSDANLRKDKFLKEKIAEKEGWVDIETLLTFNRLKALAGDSISVVAEALKKNVIGREDSVLELNEEGTSVRRTVPVEELTEEQRKELDTRTIHFKGIPSDATLDEIRVFCSQYGKVETVEMRRRREDRAFKGCVMCVYSSLEDAKRALEGKEVYDPDVTFLRENKTSYWERKKQFMEERKNKRRNRGENKEGDDKNGEGAKKEEEDSDPIKVKDAVVILKDVDTKTVNYQVIKDFFKQFGDVKYVDMQEEEGRSVIRFNKTEEAANVIKKNEEGVTIDGKTYAISLMTGEEELEFWKGVNSALKNAVPKDKHAHRSKGRGFKRGGGGYRGNNDRYNSKNRNDNRGSQKRSHDDVPRKETPDKKAKQEA